MRARVISARTRRLFKSLKGRVGGAMKWLEKLVDKCIERKPVKVVMSKAELLRLIEEAEREQLKGIFRRNGYDEV